jgi:hypothetical protein
MPSKNLPTPVTSANDGAENAKFEEKCQKENRLQLRRHSPLRKIMRNEKYFIIGRKTSLSYFTRYQYCFFKDPVIPNISD